MSRHGATKRNRSRLHDSRAVEVRAEPSERPSLRVVRYVATDADSDQRQTGHGYTSSMSRFINEFDALNGDLGESVGIGCMVLTLISADEIREIIDNTYGRIPVGIERTRLKTVAEQLRGYMGTMWHNAVFERGRQLAVQRAERAVGFSDQAADNVYNMSRNAWVDSGPYDTDPTMATWDSECDYARPLDPTQLSPADRLLADQCQFGDQIIPCADLSNGFGYSGDGVWSLYLDRRQSAGLSAERRAMLRGIRSVRLSTHGIQDALPEPTVPVFMLNNDAPERASLSYETMVPSHVWLLPPVVEHHRG